MANSKGSYPKSSAYLHQQCIDEHLAAFAGGVSWLIDGDTFLDYQQRMGRDDGQFVSPIAETMRVISESGCDPSKTQELLALDRP